MSDVNRCPTCGRLPYGMAKRGCIGDDIDIDCLRAARDNLAAELAQVKADRDEAVRLLWAARDAGRWSEVAIAAQDFLARIASGEPAPKDGE